MLAACAAVVVGFAENGVAFVVFGTVAFSLVMGVLFLVTGGNDSLYDQIGQGGISREEDGERVGGAALLDGAAARAEQEEEIRQMLGARNERRERRGEAALDVDAELERLLGERAKEPRTHDAGLVDEVRQMVVARNERRVRKGLSPLDVESEVSRTLDELDP